MLNPTNQAFAQPPSTQTNQQPAPAQPNNDIAQLQTDLKAIQLQNAQLKGTLSSLQTGMQTPAAQAPAQPEDFTGKFDPAVGTAIQGLVAQKMAKLIDPIKGQLTQNQNALGAVWDRLDESMFTQKYSGEKFAKYTDKVDEIRQQQIAEGKFVSREDALKLVYFEETMHKPQPNPAPAPIQPEWDTALNMFVQPGTTTPWAPGDVVQPPAQQTQPQVQTQPQPQVTDPQQQQIQQPQPQMQPQVNQQFQQQQPQFQTNVPQEPPPFFTPQQDQSGMPPQNNLQNQPVPMQNVNTGIPQMPNANPTAAMNFQAPSQQAPDFMSMNEQQLNQWETKYGDVPL